MKYLSEFGNKVFDTEQACLDYENTEKKRIEEERRLREKAEMVRQERLDAINKKQKELEKLIKEYGDEYGVQQEIHFSPFCELVEALNALCR